MNSHWPGRKRALAILGAGGAAREVYWYARALGVDEVCFVDDVTGITELVMGSETIPVITDWGRFDGDLGVRFQHFTAAVGDPSVKKLLCARALAAGLLPAPPLVHPSAIICGSDCVLGAGSVISPGVVITTNVVLGEHVLVNYNTTIGHDVTIGDFTTVNPGATISGNVTIGNEVMVGAGSFIREKIRIRENCTIGAQAAIVRDVREPGSVIVGVPGKPLPGGPAPGR